MEAINEMYREKKSVLVMCDADPMQDPRPNRMIRYMSQQHDVTVAGRGDGIPGVEDFISIPTGPPLRLSDKLSLAGRYLFRQYRRLTWPDELVLVKQRLAARSFDLIVVHDLHLVPLALALDNRAGIILDAKEYYAQEFSDRLSWRFLVQPFKYYLCRTYLQQVDRIMTVSDGLARRYHEEFGVQAEVVMSLPGFTRHAPSPVDPDHIRIIHHGLAIPSRHIEGMIEMMAFVDRRFHLDLMLVTRGQATSRYLLKLQKLADQKANVNIIPPVPLSEIIPFCNQYDIGLFLLPPEPFNYKYTLPNKLFEFIQARLAVAIGPSIEMKKIVEAYDCGCVAEDFHPRTLASCLNRIDTAQLERYKRHAGQAARVLNTDTSHKKIDAMVEQIFTVQPALEKG